MRRAIAPLVGLALCAALWLPSADRSERVALGLGHLLSKDLDAAFAKPAPALRASFFAVLHDRTRSHDSLAATFRVDGEPVSLPAFERALSAQLNRYSAAHRAGQSRIRRDATSPLAVLFAIDTRNDAVRVDAVWSDASSRVAGGLERRIPGRTALLPPILAVGVALLFRRTLLALFSAVYVGAVLMALQRGDGAGIAWLTGLRDVLTVYFRNELFDTFRIEIIGFVIALVAMIGVMTRAGGVQGLVDRMLEWARSVRSALFVTWGMGVLIFFDDYANCMLVGSTMRPLTDRLRISREKLAYVVDSTAAPIAGISLLSTWIAFEVSVFSAQLPEAGITQSGYAVFLQALPFRYYCLFTLLFVVATIVSGRDFGPMAKAEQRARTEGLLVRPGGRPPISDRLSKLKPAPQMRADWRIGVAPIAVTLLMTVWRIFVDGGGLDVWVEAPESLWTLAGITPVLLAGGGAAPIFVGASSGLLVAVFLAGSTATRVGCAVAAVVTAVAADPVAARLGSFASEAAAGYLAVGVVFAGVAFAIGGTLGRVSGSRRASLGAAELWGAARSGSGALGFAVTLLFCAWMIGAVCRDLATADYLVALLAGALPPVLLPLLLFGAGCAVSFATGSSWSTMAILLPNVVGLAAALGADTAIGTLGMVAISIAAVLDGSIFGDHCSPISDTTVLSSVSSGSDHIDHVRTQAPYALVTAALAVLCGYLPAVFISGWILPLAIGCAGLAVAVLLASVGRSPAAEPSHS
jgi:Na+/H+ antiporter NhaC